MSGGKSLTNDTNWSVSQKNRRMGLLIGTQVLVQKVNAQTETQDLSFIQFDQADQLLFSNNVVHTILIQTVIRLHNSTNCVIIDNIINHSASGNSVAQTGDRRNNYYRPVIPANTAVFDNYKY